MQKWLSTKLDVLIAACRSSAPDTYAEKVGAATNTLIFTLLTAKLEPEKVTREAEQLVVSVTRLTDGEALLSLEMSLVRV